MVLPGGEAAYRHRGAGPEEALRQGVLVRAKPCTYCASVLGYRRRYDGAIERAILRWDRNEHVLCDAQY
eukprot:513643-Rhodomonas_salina.1